MNAKLYDSRDKDHRCRNCEYFTLDYAGATWDHAEGGCRVKGPKPERVTAEFYCGLFSAVVSDQTFKEELRSTNEKLDAHLFHLKSLVHDLFDDYETDVFELDWKELRRLADIGREHEKDRAEGAAE